ncbi:hypothetical protein TRIP_C20249 [Candidatus Zixiibacteriota bacterium]|nr:hypothetical protein TRIP_C20249 [candidate division Zixibacteria bacterium]
MKIAVILSIILILGAGLFAAEIHDAARGGDLEKVKSILMADPGAVGALNETGSTPLHSAAYNGQLAMSEYLISAGADINALSAQGSAPLHGASFYGHLEVVKLLIAKGAKVNVANRYGFIPLLSAAAGGNTEIVAALIEAGGDTSARITDGGLNALQLAAYNGHLGTAQYLISKGFDLNQKTETGETFLHAAVMTDSVNVVKFALDNGIDPNATNNMGETPLHQAVMSVFWQALTPEKTDMIKLLLGRGAKINARHNRGDTPLSRAIMSGNSQVVQLLLESGADVNNINDDGMTPLASAIKDSYLEIAGLLLDKGAMTETREIHYGLTPLHLAVLGGNLDIVKVLIDRVKDVNAKDNSGMTPLDYANNYGHRQVADILIKKGCTRGVSEQYPGASDQLAKGTTEGTAQLWYLGHCGWAIKTANHLMVFDYFPGNALPTELSLVNGHINPEEIKDMNVEVFVSHNHQDHYSPVIFGWQPTAKNLTYIFGFRPEELPENARQGYDGRPYEYIGPREAKTVDGMQISTIRANDGGVGFLIEADGLKIFHAGDHAGWDNGESQPFTSEIDYLAGLTPSVDMAFINTTGCRFSRDTLALQQSVFYTIEKLFPRLTIPTHGQGREYVYRDYAARIKANNFKTDVVCADFKGDRFEYIRRPL